MKKLTKTIIFSVLITINSLSFSATLNSMNKSQIEKAFINKTLISIPTDNLNGHTIDNTFSMFLDSHGNIQGKLSHKPINEPQTDTGVFTIEADGTFYITWKHWDGAKKLCGHIFNTNNSYISVDCDNVFHTAFMKEVIQTGNHLEKTK